MNPATQKVLEDLAEKRDVSSICFCLTSLEREDVDGTFSRIAARALDSFGGLKEEDLESHLDELHGGLSSLSQKLGAVEFLRLIEASSISSAHLDAALICIDPEEVRRASVDCESMLENIAENRDVGADAALWLATIAAPHVSRDAPLFKPFLKAYAVQIEAESGNIAVIDFGESLAAQPGVVEEIYALLAADLAEETLEMAGMLRLLGRTDAVANVELIGPYLEDVSAWIHISRAALTSERLEGLARSAEAAGITALVADLRESEVSASDSASQLAKDPRFHRAAAKLISSRESYLAVGKLLADTRVLAAFRHLVSDNDVPIRESAAKALADLGFAEGVPFLKSGLVDRNARVRKASQDALVELLDPAEYEALIDDMQSEVGFLRERMKVAADWAKESLSKIESNFAAALGATKQGATWLGGTARRIFGRE